MEFKGKKLEDLVVTLPYADGTSLDCGVYSYFEVNNKSYFALLPLKGERELDFSQSYMLYEVDEDEEQNPIIVAPFVQFLNHTYLPSFLAFFAFLSSHRALTCSAL